MSADSASNGHAPDGVRVFLRPIGSAMPLGFSGLAIASLVLTGLQLGWVAAGRSHHVGELLLVTAVPLQLIAAVLAYLARDAATGGAMGVLGVTWAGTGVVLTGSAPGSTSSALGLVLLAAGGLLMGAALIAVPSRMLHALVVVLAGTRFAVSGIYELSGSGGWRDAAGWMGLAVMACAAYAVWAFDLEDARGRPVLPTLRRGAGARAISAPLSDQVADVEHEAGVRRQL